MNIHPIHTSYINSTLKNNASAKKLSFGETPICSINLKRKQKDNSYKFIPAHFSQLDPQNSKDEALMDRIEKVWGKRKDSYANDIATIFRIQNGRSVNNNFYVISRDDLNDPYRKITCIMQTTNTDEKDKSYFCIDYLQAHPNIENNPSSTIKGSGELSLYGCVKEAKENGFKKIFISSSNNPFYEHLNLEPGERKNTFIIDESEYDAFISRVEEKYNIEE